MSEICEYVWLEKLDYSTAWSLQRKLADLRRIHTIPDTLLLLEHPPTITLGRAADHRNLLASPISLADQGFALIESDRGGDVTYHGPGQLVAYPILDLQTPPHLPDLHRYLRNLEEVIIRTVADCGIKAERFAPHTGVWLDKDGPMPRKIAAIGIKVSRWITQHGLALNINPDLSHFDRIIPCGIKEYGVTSLERELPQLPDTGWIRQRLISHFGDVFGLEMRPHPHPDRLQEAMILQAGKQI